MRLRAEFPRVIKFPVGVWYPVPTPLDCVLAATILLSICYVLVFGKDSGERFGDLFILSMLQHRLEQMACRDVNGWVSWHE